MGARGVEIFRYCENGTIRFLWVTGTNPAVSLPELHRIRSLYGSDRLFLVVSDAFPTETTALADVVLPAALWGEKTGCFTNAGRTVHLAQQAVEPPGEARSDFDTLLDYARRMHLTDRAGSPLLPWRTPEDAWTDFTALTGGRPCDQSALTYDKLRDSGGVQWPCTDRAPGGTERLYTDHVFPTAADRPRPPASTARLPPGGGTAHLAGPHTDPRRRAGTRHRPAGPARGRAAATAAATGDGQPAGVRPAGGETRLRLYLSGDTLLFDGLDEIGRRYPDTDLAVLYLGGTTLTGGFVVTMDGAQGAELVRRPRPRLVLPVHYDDYTVFKSPLSDFLAEADARSLGERVAHCRQGQELTVTAGATRATVSG